MIHTHLIWIHIWLQSWKKKLLSSSPLEMELGCCVTEWGCSKAGSAKGSLLGDEQAGRIARTQLTFYHEEHFSVEYG
jgi:hypothetical protein